jgi:nucleoside 2-deoxyribosyltransferase
MTLRVYLAAASSDLDRVDRWAAALAATGVRVVSTWPANVRSVGSANPREASRLDRARWAERCLAEVRAAHVVWFLVPPIDKPTRGAWFEIGYALAQSQAVVASGDTRQSIFCAVADYEYASDAEAFDSIRNVRWARENGLSWGRP